MPVRPISRAALLAGFADRIVALRPGWHLRVAMDGPPPAEPGGWADQLVDELRERGRAAIHVPADGFLRPASQRLEYGRTNADAFYELWRDDDALRREVLQHCGPGGDGRVLPSLWDSAVDRATRADYVTLPEEGVVIVSGGLLLGGGLTFDLALHFEMSAAALVRHLTPGLQWTLPAYERYASEVAPSTLANVVVRLNDRHRPAVVER